MKLLIDCPKVDRTIRDNDNLLPEDIAATDEVKNIIRILGLKYLQTCSQSKFEYL